MKKYNLSKIMKRAWELVKKAGMTISSGLKKAWEEAKGIGKSLKEQLTDKLNKIANEANSHDNGFVYKTYVSEWENYGKIRTYFSIYETRSGSKHSKKISYGYYDNQKNVYVPEKYKNLMDDYTISGARM